MRQTEFLCGAIPQGDYFAYELVPRGDWRLAVGLAVIIAPK
jgi:hypothetical protein